MNKIQILPTITFLLVSNYVLAAELVEIPDISESTIESISRNSAILPEPTLPKADFSGEDDLPIPEGVRPIQGLNIPIKMKEVKIYGLTHESYDVAFLEKTIFDAVEFHNSLENAPQLKGGYKVQRKGQMYSIQVNDDVHLALVYAIAQEITNKYQSDQFLLARAIVPEQTIDQKAGSIEICVAEGYLSSDPLVVFPSSVKNSEKLSLWLAPYLSHLKEQKPLDFRTLERSLLLIRDMAGVEVKTTFKQATAKVEENNGSASICEQALNNGAGSTQLEVRANVDRFEGQISVDNYGTDLIGPELVRLKAGANSILQMGDRFGLNVSNTTETEESLTASIDADIPIGVDGVKAKVLYSNSDAVPGGDDDFTSATEIASLGFEYAYQRSRKQNITFEAGVKWQDVLTQVGGVEFENSDLTTLRLRSIYDFSDKYNGINLVTAELVAGLDGSFESILVTNSEGVVEPPEQNAILIRGEMARYQAIALNERSSANLTWINSLSWQYTDDPLFSSEEFGLGGREYGRGFDLSIISGDRAIALKTELQYSDRVKYGKYKVYGFADYGRVINLDKGSEDAGQKDRYLTSIGAGLDFDANNNLYIKLEVTNPIQLGQDEIDDSVLDPNAYFQIGYRW